MPKPRMDSDEEDEAIVAGRFPGVYLRLLLSRKAMIGPGKANLLEAIEETGSISAAGRRLGMSYRRAWLLVDSLNSSFRAPVVSAVPGGRGGGGASLTPLGREVLERYRTMQDTAQRVLADQLDELTTLLATD